jgi:hypothetical protein
MALPQPLRKATLTIHVVVSVGWLGAVATFLALAVTGLTSADATLVRGAYVATEVITWLVIVPLGVASLASGIVQSLGSSWGLLRHYWVVAKLVLTALATALLLVHAGPIGEVAEVAAMRSLSDTDFAGLRAQLVVQAGAAVLVLLTTTALSVFKPRGLTRRGWREQVRQRTAQ